MKEPLRVLIEFDGTMINVSLDMTAAERSAALASCSELRRVLNDSMANISRKFEKIPTTGEASRQTMLAMANRLQASIAEDERAACFDVSVRAVYHTEAVIRERRDAETGGVL